jgi:CspA family cold shock protein
MADKGLEVTAPEQCDTCTRKVSYGGRLHGRIKWFDLGKGYGFISEDTGKELFFHRSGVSMTGEGKLPSLPEGQEVLYDVKESPKGPQAVQVTPYQG